MNKRSRVQGLLENKMGVSMMTLIPTGSDIQSGDTLITSNISTVFPKGFRVGTVKKIQQAPDAVYMSAIFIPFVDISNLEQVIILPPTKEEQYDTISE